VTPISAKLRLSPRTLGLIGAILGVMAIVAFRPLYELLQVKPAPTPPKVQLPPTPKVKLPPTPDGIAKPHLAWAEKECEQAIDEHIKVLDGFFADAQKNTHGFAEEALSLGSKLRLIADYVPYTRGGRHETFIRRKFEAHIFTPKKLEDVLKQVVNSYLKHVQSIEGKMLVDMRTDSADFPGPPLTAHLDSDKLNQAYEQAVARAVKATGTSLTADIGAAIVSMITVDVLGQVARQMVVSASILGAGGASSWPTLGIGFVIGLIVDQIVSWVWDWYADPTGDLTAKLNSKLDEMHRLIVDGSKDVQGFRSRLLHFSQERAKVRRRALLDVLQSQLTGTK
jgi:hypothetical protein